MPGRRRIAQNAAQRAFQRIRKEEEWSTEEKLKLLAAIKCYGTLDMDSILNALPHRSPVEVRNFLASRKAEGIFRNADPQFEAPLDQWLSALGATDERGGGLLPNCSRDICKVQRIVTDRVDLPAVQMLTIIAETEQHPPPEACQGVDCQELYRYLADLLSGVHPRKMSVESSRFMIDACLWMSGIMMSNTNELQVIKNLLQKQSRLPISKLPPVHKSYSSKKQPKSHCSLFYNKEINPLNIPESFALIKDECFTLWGQPGFGVCTTVASTLWQEATEESTKLQVTKL